MDTDTENFAGWWAQHVKAESDAIGGTCGLTTFLDAYMTCALWSSTDDADRPMDDAHTFQDLDQTTRDAMRADCVRFLTENADDIGEDYSRAGHDFWLTRNRHGAGFWDGDWPNGDTLTEAAHSFPEVGLYVGDDGRIYQA